MAGHLDEGALAVSSPAPPRAVPIRLRCQLLAGGATVWGSVIFGFASVLAVGLVSGMDPLGSLRLALHRQEAPGRVLSERDTNYEENDSTVRRHDYEFRLPDGTLLQGHSYSGGHRYVDVPTVPGDPDPQRGSRVTIEYDPGHPETNRIKGTQTHSVSHWVACMLIFPAGALLVAAIGLIGGWCRIRLLRDGELARATVTGCTFPTNAESPPDVPVAECRRLLAEQAERASRSPFVLLWNGVNSAWCLAVLLMVVGGVVFLLFGMVKVGLGADSFSVNGEPARGIDGVVRMGIGLVVWVFAGGVMFFGGRRLRIPRRDASAVVDCAYEFRLPGGEVVRARDSVPAAALGAAEAPLPVLYNPKWPTETLLLAALTPPVRVSSHGGWETTAGPWPLLRLAVALLALAGGPLLGLAIAVS
jgi:Protein of unknown function (DUF3592)